MPSSSADKQKSLTATATVVPSQRKHTALVGVGLILVVFALFGRVLRHDYVSYDDTDYVSENKMVQLGLTLESVKWAFQFHGYAANWHPLTWLSHILDWQLFGNKPGWHHFTNVIFHALNSALLFLLLTRIAAASCCKIFSAFWSSAFAAALFALHPLHVESVAWLAERKDVLSTFFALLTLLAYARYVEFKVQGFKFKVVGYYALAVLFLAFGLMSKPMLVTLPFVMLLLDFWPFGRVSSLKFEVSSSQEAPTSNLKLQTSNLARVILEKLPFFVLSVISSFITFQVQKGKTIQSLQNFSVLDRISNVLVSYVLYLWKMVWPAKLAFFYPLITAPPLWQAALAGGLLIGITALCFLLRQRFPFALTGWLWYLGTLVPVIGLVHVGEQSHADRYTYIPSIGIFFAVAWVVADFIERKRRSKTALQIVALAVLGACSFVTWKQIGYWKNSRAMLERALAVTEKNFLAHNNYGVVLADEGKELEAAGKIQEARAKYEEAITHYAEAVRWKPVYARAFDNWGSALTLLGRTSEAVEKFQTALSLNPSVARTHYNLAVTLAREKRYDETIAECREALRLDPNYVDAHYDLGSALALKGLIDEAVSEYEKYIEARPGDSLAHYLLASVAVRQKDFAKAAAHYREAIRLKSDFDDPYTKLAWLLATSPEDSVRDGAEAVRLAERAAQLTKFQHSYTIAVLAAAYAESGRFEDAIKTAEQARALAEARNSLALANAIQRQIESYRAGKPFREIINR